MAKFSQVSIWFFTFIFLELEKLSMKFLVTMRRIVILFLVGLYQEVS